MSSLLLLLEELAASGDSSGSSGGDETSLHTAWSVSSDGGWVTNVLMVTTTMRMLNWVLSDTSDAWPVLSLGLSLEPSSVGLEEWLVSSLATSANADHASAGALHGLSDSGWESQSRLSAVLRVSDDDGGGAGGSGESAAVSLLGLNIGDDGSLWHLADWENVANSERSL